MHQGREGQRIPNECLLVVIEHLYNDLKTLRNLLLVNKICFKAVAPVLYRAPLRNWSNYLQQRCSGKNNSNDLIRLRPEKFAALMLASVIHSQRAASQSKIGTGSKNPFEAATFLKKYGLRPPSMIESPLIQDAVQGVSPTTVDYSQYLTMEPHWPFVNFMGIVRLVKIPPMRAAAATVNHSLDENDHESYIDNGDMDQEEYHPLDIQSLPCYIDDIGRRISRLLHLCSSTNSVETLLINDQDTHTFKSLANKMPKLRTLQLDWKTSVSQTCVADLVTFIKAHQAVFPKKKPLRIEIMGDRSRYLQMRELKRDRNKFRIELYEAIGNPPEMDASSIPGFYEMAGNIALESLVEFRDNDGSRFTNGENPRQASFLQQCDNLEVLQLQIFHPDIISWAAYTNQLGSLQQHPKHALPILKQLTLNTSSGLNVMEDVMKAFGRTLHHVKYTSSAVFGTYSPENPPIPPRYLRQTLIGNWDVPCLRTLELKFEASAVFSFGRFDQCPLLESLSVILSRRQARRIGQSPLVSDGLLLTCPVWKLPCLQSLRLECEAAMLFNFDSLGHMPALQSLVLSTLGDFEQPISTFYVPRLSAYHCHKYIPGIAEATPSSDLLVENTKWTDHWDLPRLKTLYLEGPPSSVFCFQWLASCPSLESMHLMICDDFQRLPISSSSKNASVLPIDSFQMQSGAGADFESVNSSEVESETAQLPLVESKLRSITLRGPWVMSEHDLSKVLTVYAPNLTSLSVDRIHAVTKQEEKAWHGIRFVKTVAAAIGMEHGCGPATKGEMAGSASEFKPGSQLNEIASTYDIKTETENELGTMGLVAVAKTTVLRADRRMEYLHFGFHDDCFVRAEDKRTWECSV
ncbi:hypothetical protein BGZ82_003345 [Podila clonocystis]|nr:hypothetical protein BGZ82_003345 [Podila clonocystis]